MSSNKTEVASKRAKMLGKQIHDLIEQGKTLREAADIVAYSYAYTCTLHRAYEADLNKEKMMVSGSPSLLSLASSEDKPHLQVPVIEDVEDVPLVCFLHMNGVRPQEISCKPGTTFVYFSFHNSETFRELRDRWYDGAEVVGLEYARASRYIFSLIKRFTRGERINFQYER